MKYLKLTKPWLGKEEAEAVQKVLDSGWLTEGEVTREFENVVARYVGAKYGVAISNCTVALTLCLKVLDITGNVEIPAFTHPATALAVFNAGATPVLHDVNLQSYNMMTCSDPQRAISVSWGGNPYCAEATIEDAACSLGAERYGKKVGIHAGGIACFSFHPRKLVTTGEGGMVVTNSEHIAYQIRQLKDFGLGGGNYKLSDVNSAIGLEQMQKIDKIVHRRIEMAQLYNDLLAKEKNIKVPLKHPRSKHTYQTYAVYLDSSNRDEVIKKLAEKNIESQIGTYALHKMFRFHDLDRVGALLNSELLYEHLLALPMAYDLTDDDQQRVVDELKNALA